jgi:hypothetical protein
MTIYFIKKEIYNSYPKEFFQKSINQSRHADAIVDMNNLIVMKDGLKKIKKYSSKEEFWKFLNEFIDKFDGMAFEEYDEKEMNSLIFG